MRLSTWNLGTAAIMMARRALLAILSALAVAAAEAEPSKPAGVRLSDDDDYLNDDGLPESILDQQFAQARFAATHQKAASKEAEQKVAAAQAEFAKREQRREVAEEMHELWCADGNKWETTGPCRKHVVLKHLKDEKIDQKTATEYMKAIDTLVSRELGQEQNAEMHDWYCGRKEVVKAAADSPRRTFCDGWAQHSKLKEEL